MDRYGYGYNQNSHNQYNPYHNRAIVVPRNTHNLADKIIRILQSAANIATVATAVSMCSIQ